MKCYNVNSLSKQPEMPQSTEVRFASFFSGGLITAIVVNLLERKLVKRTSVQSGQGQLKLTHLVTS